MSFNDIRENEFFTNISIQYLSHMFVCFDAFCPSHQFFSHVRTGLPRLNQY